jgi:hypothetical protein
MMTQKPRINQTKVSVPAPPKPRTHAAQFVGMPSLVEEVPPTRNLVAPSTTRSADLNFKVSEEFHRAFKGAATLTGISMKELLEEAFNLWVEQNQVPVSRDALAGVVQHRSRGRLHAYAGAETPRAKARPRPRRTPASKPDMFRGDPT